MSDPQGQKKKNKKKKKTSPVVNQAPPPPSIPDPAPEICQNGAEKESFSINEVLPQKVGMKTVFKDVEVTMTHSGAAAAVNQVANATSKKKKKKKKPKQDTTELPQEAPATETDSQNNFFKFNDDRIELLNHPEISVTLSKSVEVPKQESKKSPEKVTPDPVSKQEVGSAAIDTKKKKKNKKKKKKNAETSLPADPVPETADASYTAPTYVKLPASGDSCVLLVSHESFSNDNKASTANNTEKENIPNNSKTVLVQSKERKEELKGISALNSKSQNPASVSIFPVVSESKKMPEKSDVINMDSSLQKVGILINQEMEGSNPAGSPTELQEAGASSEGTTLTKAQLKAERRAKQEAQRAAKLAKSGESNPSVTHPKVQVKSPADSESVPAKKPENAVSTTNKAPSKSSVEKESPRNIFSHLPQCKDSSEFSNNHSNIHPAILEIGAYYRSGVVFGSNARCVGFLAAFRDVIKDHETPPNKELARDLELELQASLNFLNSCRPLSVSILNSVRFLKHQINHIPKGMAEEKVKENLCLAINNFVKEEILLAKEAICISATAKIVDGDTILVFAYSSLVKDVLCKAYDQKKSFQVVVVESRSKMEGNEMMRRLLKHGLRCCYVPASAASSMMKTVSKVIIGAHALLANGSVMSRVGSMKIVEIAESYGVPVLVCCETYKFCERALTDSFVHNELGNAEDLTHFSCNTNDSLKNWKSLMPLQIHNILYDVTPSELISVVITEKGLLPCTSVPVVLRVKQAGLQE